MVADQAAKAAALALLGLDGAGITVIPGLLWLQVIKNTGAAFGLFQQMGPVLALVTLVLLYAGYKMSRNEDDPVLLVSLSLILGGAGGNLIDRVFRAGVIDFIRVPSWPLFNLADCAITVGTAGVLYYGFLRRQDSSTDTNVSNPV